MARATRTLAKMPGAMRTLAAMARAATLGAVLGLAACATAPRPDPEALAREVADTERAFARTMAERDHAAFTRFLADEAVFFSGPTPLRGKAAVASYWRRFFERPSAPFSWVPDQVQVLDSGTLALSAGPVHDAAGTCIGRFSSVWRREAPGVWRVVFDRGEPCEQPASAP